jgi:hypothetical protein
MIDALFICWLVAGLHACLIVMLGAMMEHRLSSDPKEATWD